MWELRERGEVLSVQTRAKPAEAARAGFAEGAIAAELAVLHRRSFELRAPVVRCQLWAFPGADAGADLCVRITIMLPNPTFRLIENPVVPRDSVIYT